MSRLIRSSPAALDIDATKDTIISRNGQLLLRRSSPDKSRRYVIHTTCLSFAARCCSCMPSRAIVIRFGKLSNKISLRTAAAAGAHASAIRFRVYDADAAYACARSFLYSILPLALTYVRFDLLASRTNVSVGTAMPPHRRCLSPPADVSILSSTCSTRRADNDDERGDSRSRGIFFTMGRREGGERSGSRQAR